MTPVLYPDELDLALAAIEDLEPDLIFTLGADITRDEYSRLSDIAPVVHGPGEENPPGVRPSTRSHGPSVAPGGAPS